MASPLDTAGFAAGRLRAYSGAAPPGKPLVPPPRLEWDRQAARHRPFFGIPLPNEWVNDVRFMTRERRISAGEVLGSVILGATFSLAKSPAFFRSVDPNRVMQAKIVSCLIV